MTSVTRTMLRKMTKKKLTAAIVNMGGNVNPKKSRKELLDYAFGLLEIAEERGKKITIDVSPTVEDHHTINSNATESSSVSGGEHNIPQDEKEQSNKGDIAYIKRIAKLRVIDNIPQEDIAMYHVRYLGTNGIVHNVNSTITKTAYEFPSRQWVEVKRPDFLYKYYDKVIRALQDEQYPVWECAVTLNDGTFFIFFHDIHEEVAKYHASSLSDLYGFTKAHLDILEKNDIRSIRDFMTLPDHMLVEKLGAPMLHIAYWRQQGIEALKLEEKKMKKTIQEMISNYE